MQQIAAHDVGLDPFNHRRQGLHRASAPTDKRAFGNVRTQAREDFVLTIKGEVIVELGDQHMRQQVRTCHAAGDRAAWCGLLHHPLAATAGFLDAGDLNHLHLGSDHIE